MVETKNMRHGQNPKYTLILNNILYSDKYKQGNAFNR